MKTNREIKFRIYDTAPKKHLSFKQLEEQNADLKEELQKADSITQSCIFNSKKESELSYRKVLNLVKQLKKENEKLKNNWNELREYINKNCFYDGDTLTYEELIEKINRIEGRINE